MVVRPSSVLMMTATKMNAVAICAMTKVLPASVAGTMSPYPTVALVTIEKYNV